MVDKVSFIKEQFGQLNFKYWDLLFMRPARTSRNTLLRHQVCFVWLKNNAGKVVARGEIAPIIGLSSESWDEIDCAIQSWIQGEFEGCKLWPSSVKAAIDMLWQDLFPTPIPEQYLINGLVWMNDLKSMYAEALEKHQQGFRCIKLKVGALDFQEELKLIQSLRNQWGNDVVIRLDANGAWKPNEALEKLETLSHWNIHSIEQPIASGQWKAICQLSQNSPIPIALDEELIGVGPQQMAELLDGTKPQFLVIKPSLHGGFESANAWIDSAEKRGIHWWATSALESNVGLSHLYRWLGNYKNKLPQGLGTGHLYTNNWISPLTLNGQFMSWDEQQEWRAPWS
ncbi:MAG: hypothetical protein RLY35_1588 [Bacteroidota bacterium]